MEGDEVRIGMKKSDASGKHEVFCIGKKSGKTSGMDKDYGFVFSNDPFSDLIDHAGHGFTGINRIEENPLGFSNQFQQWFQQAVSVWFQWPGFSAPVSVWFQSGFSAVSV